MNGEIHQYIVKKGFELLPEEIKKKWKNGEKYMLKTCMYPDMFADRSSIKNPEVIKYLEPFPPKTKWYKKLMKKMAGNPILCISDAVPEKLIHIFAHYLKKVSGALKKMNYEESAKLSGVFSHIIGDTAQPIHSLNPGVIDLILKVPEKFLSFELHSGIERISSFPKVKNYSPEILGFSIPQAIMGLYRKIKIMNEEARFTTLPIVQEVYSGNTKKAQKLAGVSVEFAIKVFADFLFTCWVLSHQNKFESSPLDLTEYPYINSQTDMLYRYKALKNISLIPYSGGKYHPLSLKEKDGKISKVKGLGVIPYLGPKKTIQKEIKEREAKVEFFLWPKSYSFFKAKVGINPLFKESKGKVIFRIFADDKLIFKTSPISPDTPAIDIKVNLPEKTHFLTLSMLTVKEPPAPLSKTHPHGVWAYPSLE